MEKIKQWGFKNKQWIILFIFLIVFIFMVINIINENISDFDIKGYKIISKYLILDNITPIIKIITNLGGICWLIGFSIFLFIIIKNRNIGLSVGINLCLAASINYILKHILQRPRPVEYRLIEESGYSLPSGHSMVSMAFYGYLIYLILKNVKNRYVKISVSIFLSVLILCIGISRIYLGVHYTSDVICGFLLGIVYLISYIEIIKLIKKGENQNGNAKDSK